MKHIFATIGAACTAALLLTACSPEDFASPDGNALPKVSDYSSLFSVAVDQSTNTATFTFDDKDAKGITPVWIIDGAYSSSVTASKYYRKKGDYKIAYKVKNANGISQDTDTLRFSIDKTKMNGFAGFVTDSPYNLFNTATFSPATFWYAPGWSQIADPTYSETNHDYTVTLPKATTDQWQAQMFVNTNVALQAGKHYDFSCIFTSTTAQKRGVTLKLASKSDPDFALYFNGSIKLEANEPLCVYFSDVECPKTIDDLQLVLDFGGNADNTVMNIESLVIKDHDNDDGTVVPEAPKANFDYNSADNLWLPVDQNSSAVIGGYYAPGWSQIANAEVTQDGDEYTIKLPSATSDRWQAQVAFDVADLTLEADQEYDFSVTVSSNNALGGVTAKVNDGADKDGTFLNGTDAMFKVPAGGSYTFQVAKEKMSGTPAKGVKLVFDFGGNPANTEVHVSKIIIQKHKE